MAIAAEAFARAVPQPAKRPALSAEAACRAKGASLSLLLLPPLPWAMDVRLLSPWV